MAEPYCQRPPGPLLRAAWVAADGSPHWCDNDIMHPLDDDPPVPVETLAALFEGSTDAVYAVDAGQRVVFMNRVAEQAFGLTSAEAVGQHCFRLVAGMDYDGNCTCRAECATIRAARASLPVADYDVLVHPLVGRRRWVSMGIVVARVAGFEEPVAVHMARDLTSRRELLPEEAVAGAGEAAHGLTPREIEVVRMLAGGSPVRQIAQELVVTPATVRNHIENLMGKLGAHSRLQAVLRAAKIGILS